MAGGPVRIGGALRVVGWLLLASMAGGCASIVGGQMQAVSVETPGCLGARCELVNDKGRFHVTSTPGTVTLIRSYNNLQVSCTRDGVHSEIVSVASRTKGLAFGNILLGGVIGAGVDVSTGAAYDYPQTITVSMTCPDAARPANVLAEAPRLGLRIAAAGKIGAGVRVVAVDDGSAASAAGLLAGDLIVAVDGTPVATPDAVAAALRAPGAEPAHRLHVRRDGQDLWLSLSAPVGLPAAPPAAPATYPAAPS